MKRYASIRELVESLGAVRRTENGPEARGDLIEFDAKLVWQVTISIANIQPAIWRRILLPEDYNVAQLHEVIQAVFGWTDSHLHQFVVVGIVVGAPEFDEDGDERHRTFDASWVVLRDLVLHDLGDARILYKYDFGDGWRHWITIDRRLSEAPGVTYPLLIDGRRSAPPEDSGGPHGYMEFLEAWRDPEHEGHRVMRRWARRSIDAGRGDHGKLGVESPRVGQAKIAPRPGFCACYASVL